MLVSEDLSEVRVAAPKGGIGFTLLKSSLGLLSGSALN